MPDITPSIPVISPINGRVHIRFDDAEIASSTKAMRLEVPGRAPQVFIPLDDVHPGILEASETTREDAGLGPASFYTIKTLTADGTDEAWYYPHAEGDYEPVRDLLTFGGDRIAVEITQV
jgi:uncharacterized protein (DUF427 family)